MCRMWQSKSDAIELPIEVWRDFVDSLADFVGGKVQIQLVGGEPFFKKGVLDLIRHIAQKGFLTTMTTNAFLIDEKMARDVVDSGLNTLVLSLDSKKSQTHDFLRGVEGTYDRLIRAFSYLSKYKNNSLNLHIVATIMQPNLDDIVGLVEWVDKNPTIDLISFQAVMQPFFTPPDETWRERDEFSILWPKDLAKIEHVLDRIIDLKKKGSKITNPIAQFEIFKSYFKDPDRFVKAMRCNLGYNSLTVNTGGDIFLCNLMEPIGNIKDGEKIEEMWSSQKALEVRNKIRSCKRNCKLMINCFFEEDHPEIDK